MNFGTALFNQIDQVVALLASAPVGTSDKNGIWDTITGCCCLLVGVGIVIAVYERLTTPKSDLSVFSGMVNASRYDKRKLNLIAASFDDGEKALAACDAYPEGRSRELFQKNPDKEFTTVILTDKYLRTYHFKENAIAVAGLQKAHRYSRDSLSLLRVSDEKLGFMGNTKSCTLSAAGVNHHYTFVPDWRKEQISFISTLEEQCSRLKAPASGSSDGLSQELQRLHYLHTVGAISESEWERAKAMVVGSAPSASDSAMKQIQQLHDLYKAGSITESEFNMKKWDILARRQ